ncbi:hypothetical protein [Streptomyces sp. MMS24-I29]|uniref:hypothetical protein n=1 Tax=Streptomyces sp. MMS24-I29 TaxID=3351480 RepID=UPI003C7C51DC
MPLRPFPHLMKPKSVLADMTVEDTASTPLWENLVPTVSNSGRPFSVRHHRQWDATVARIAGGLTLVQPARAPGRTPPPASRPSFPSFYGRTMSFWGVVGDAHLYPFGTEPTLLDTRTGAAIDEPVWCDYERHQGGNGNERHMIAPHQPAAVDLSSAVLYVEARIGEPHPPTP